MVTIPFIYFFVFLIVLYLKKREYDLPCYILTLFTVTSFFSILLEVFDLRSDDNYKYTITLHSALLYCLFITINIFPIIKISDLKYNISIGINEKLLKILSYISVLYLLVIILVAWSSIYAVMTGDMGELRKSLYAGSTELNYMLRIPEPYRYCVTLFAYMFGCYHFLLFLGFYCLAFSNNKKYGWLFIIASLVGPIQGVAGADRSAMAYWLISMGASVFLFKKYIEKNDFKIIKKAISIFGFFFIAYLSLMTISRFGASDEGSGGSLISYFGMNFINFAYYFDDYVARLDTLQRIFPLTYRFIIGSEFSSTVELNDYISAMTGMNVGIFSTYLGDIVISSGQWTATIFCLFITVFGIIIFNYIRNKRKHNIFTFFLFFALGSVMFMGLFTYYYAYDTRTSSLLFFMVFCKMAMKSHPSIIKRND